MRKRRYHVRQRRDKDASMFTDDAIMCAKYATIVHQGRNHARQGRHHANMNAKHATSLPHAMTGS